MKLETDFRGRLKGVAATVLGNGLSRLTFEPPWNSALFACNAAYRPGPAQVLCNFLVVTDIEMMKEVAPVYGGVVMGQRAAWKALGDTPIACEKVVLDKSLSCSGAYALYAACVMGCTPIILAGFDGPGQSIYTGTPLYTHNATHPLPLHVWEGDFVRLQKQFPKSEILVRPPSWLLSRRKPMHRPGSRHDKAMPQSGGFTELTDERLRQITEGPDRGPWPLSGGAFAHRGTERCAGPGDQ